MTKRFYDNLIFFEEIVAVVGNKKDILKIIDDTLHTHILDEILSHLPKHYHGTFLTHFQNNPTDINLLEFLKKEAREDIEKVIAMRAKRVKKELLTEVKKNK
ncbi:hypothetical protein A3A79_02910 [Candidatus Gottesmanbacteria bacterium RIFCSPLOWO2_01_FULL_43_11b]|uniref:Uncharacterized protein n=1 Tax=Candidatus Gottesmanbacteria bacterium RIFCSPLOWO2_01_FULL_43_11b TaxID=1798392 RepID=A0A1F6AHF9_9BACT|nr:MAG: hypothetical protein A3A79_02910 [Candidatus Gottesmanbacteria bacterium RIFCSPLOWO2_01_FULL_43_11b]